MWLVSRRLLHWAGALALLGVAYFAWTVLRPRACSCVDFDVTVRAFERLRGVDWAALDREAVREMWPGAPELPCAPVEDDPLAAIGRAIDQCADTCGSCGGVIFDDTPGQRLPPTIPVPGLRAVVVTLGRGSDVEILGEMTRLLDALGAKDPFAARGHGWSPRESESGYWNKVWWRSPSGTYRLTANIAPSEDTWAHFSGVGWRGWLDVEQRAVAVAAEEWPLDSGDSVQVLRADLYEEPPRRSYRFTYLSQCIPQTDACLAGEIRGFWPRLRERAEEQDATGIFLQAHTGFWFGSTGGLFGLEPNPEAAEGWEGFPDDRPCAEPVDPPQDCPPPGGS